MIFNLVNLCIVLALDLSIVTADRQPAVMEPSREDLVWDPAIMKSVSEEDGMSCVT